MKRNGIFLCLALALCCVFTFCVCIYGFTVTSAEVSGLTVVLDAGHGGIDKGVSGKTTGVAESEINLAVVKRLQTYFVKNGFRCVLTRKTDAGLYGMPTPGFKRRDMEERKRIIDEADPVAVISVHQNSFVGSAKERGSQVFFCKDNVEGRKLAYAIQSFLNRLSDPLPERNIQAGDYYMVNCTSCASVIVECGFLSNEEDEKLLQTEEYRDQIAKAIFEGVTYYLSAVTNERGG